jgi:hypothetical protein
VKFVVLYISTASQPTPLSHFVCVAGVARARLLRGCSQPKQVQFLAIFDAGAHVSAAASCPPLSRPESPDIIEYLQVFRILHIRAKSEPGQHLGRHHHARLHQHFRWSDPME